MEHRYTAQEMAMTEEQWQRRFYPERGRAGIPTTDSEDKTETQNRKDPQE